MKLLSLALVAWSPRALAFTPSYTTRSTLALTSSSKSTLTSASSMRNMNNIPSSISTSTSLFMAEGNEETKKTKKLDTSTRSRLLSESIAPWRTLRVFLYISLGSGAFLGGLITASGVAAALSGARGDLDLNTEYVNLAIDFGAALVFGLLSKWDFDQGDELNAKVEEKIAQKKENKVIRKAMKERELTLSQLELDIRISEDGSTQTAKVEAAQTGGKQHVIVVVGPRTAIRDALLGANILKMEFSIRDVLIVPYELTKEKSKKGPGGGQTKEDDAKLRPDGTGFGGGPRPTWETEPYVAQPVGEGWDEYIQAELDDAIKQNGEDVKEQGIAIVVANSGEIIRRGVGKVPWRNMVDELENSIKDDALSFLSG